MGSREGCKLDVFFLPFLTTSHLIPMVDIGRLFAAQGINVTIITTPFNALLLQTSIDSDVISGHPISLHILKFPSLEVGLPEGIENFGAITSPEMSSKLYQAIALLQGPIEQLFRDQRPNCIVSDMFFPWTVDIAEDLHIPRLIFNPTGFFSRCVAHSMNLYVPHEKVQSDTESFVVPGLPDQIQMTRSQLQDQVKTKTRYGELMNIIEDSELRSYGTVVNSFFELEPAYVHHIKTVMGRKAWHLGPLFNISNRASRDKTDTGNNTITEQHSCLSWLNSHKPNSVLYVCFGSMVRFPGSQLTEIALALEASGHPFIWVVKKREKSEEEERWLPEGFEERMGEDNKGMLIRGWAPQVLILDHPAVGGFMTHCGWNSILEGLTAGIPLITWPLFGEQFYNEKLITQVLRIGVAVGSGPWNAGFEITGPIVGKEKIEKAVTGLMDVSEEPEEMRRRAKELGVMAKRAVEEGGSSYSDLRALIQELKACAVEKQGGNGKP